MWLFTEWGFVSVVCARLDEGRGEPDPDLLMVRARSVTHLRALQDAFPEIAAFEITRSAKTDYPARIFVPKGVFAPVMQRMVEAIDYDNFKGRLTATKQHQYHDACTSVWGTMHRLEEPRPKRKEPTGSFWPRSWRDEPEVFDDPKPKRGRPASEPATRPYPHSPWCLCRVCQPGRLSEANETSPLAERESDRRPVGIPNPDDVLVVSEWSATGTLYTPVCVLTDLQQYRRGRIAVRDAARLGWCRQVPRRRQMLQRMSEEESRLRYPSLARVSMANVIPSRGQQNYAGAKWVPAPIPLILPTQIEEIPVNEQPKRTIESGIRAQANPAKVAMNQPPRPTPLVEDTSVVGGLDEKTGAPVIRPRTPDGVADESTRATDPREGHA